MSTIDWTPVAEAVRTARAISFDGCHKIYVLLDDKQVALSTRYGYGEDGSYLVPVTDPDAALTILHSWFDGSCGLRFIDSVRTTRPDTNEGYTTLIPQGAGYDEDEDEI